MSTLAGLAALLLLSASCRGLEPANGLAGGNQGGSTTSARAQIDLKVDVNPTRSVVTGTTLNESDRTYGIFACEHEDTPLLYPIYDRNNANLYSNIKAWYGNYQSKGTGWWYSYEATSSAYFKPLFFVTEDTSRHMDIYAYAPWKSGVTIEGGYPYNIDDVYESALEDVMYATYEDGEGNPTNTDITIVDGSTIPVNLTFHHALSRIALHLKLATAQNTGYDEWHAIRLFRIELLKNDGGTTPLITRGVMNFLTQKVTSTQLIPAQVQRVEYADSNPLPGYDTPIDPYYILRGDSYKTFNMIVHPTQYQDSADFSLKFYFNGLGEEQSFAFEYAIDDDDLNHHDDMDNPTIGFQPGFCYHFYFIIENYIHLQNVKIEEWTPTDEEQLMR